MLLKFDMFAKKYLQKKKKKKSIYLQVTATSLQ